MYVVTKVYLMKSCDGLFFMKQIHSFSGQCVSKKDWMQASAFIELLRLEWALEWAHCYVTDLFWSGLQYKSVLPDRNSATRWIHGFGRKPGRHKIYDDSSPQNLYTMTLVVTFDTLSFVDTRFKKQYAQHGQHFEILSAFFPPLFYASGFRDDEPFRSILEKKINELWTIFFKKEKKWSSVMSRGFRKFQIYIYCD